MYPRQVVIITGASSGIGKAAAIAFAEQGANVVLAARRTEALERTAGECRQRGVEAVALPTDVSRQDEVERLAKAAIERFGYFDVWINNAAVLTLGSLEQTPPEAYERALEVNFLGYVYGARAALGHFRERGRGILINNASLLATMPTGYTNAYTATKAAVSGFTDALRQELVPAGDIHVVKILPAGVDTPVLQHAANYTGRRVRPLYPLISAERVAKVMVSCARRPRKMAVVGTTGRIHGALYSLTPAFGDWVYGHAAAIALRRADPLPVTDGTLFEPVEEGTDAGGGSRRGSPAMRATAGALCALAAVAVARRRR